MPIIKSAIKRAKQALIRRSRNLQVKRAVKQDVAALAEALKGTDAKEIQTKLSEAYSEIDRAVKKGTLHKNTAARRKSKLAHHVAKAMGAEETPVEAKTTKGAGKKAATGKTTAKTTTKKTVAKKPVAKSSTKAVAEKKAPVKKVAEKTETKKATKKED